MTTNNQHTPGPWRTVIDSFGTFVETDGAPIAKLVSLDDDTNQANARLIAAAPDLLDALHHSASLVVSILQAIGVEEDMEVEVTDKETGETSLLSIGDVIQKSTNAITKATIPSA